MSVNPSRFAFLAATVPLLLACSSPAEMEEKVGADVGEGAAADETAQQRLDRRIGHGSDAVRFEDNAQDGEATREFSYSWPAQANAIAPLAAHLTEERDQMLTAQKTEWQGALREFAEMSCITCVVRMQTKNWGVTADTPRFLVLSAEVESYTGGAHGNSHFDALIWDRDAGAAIKPMALFADEVALENTTYGQYCDALAQVKRERLGADMVPANGFEACPSVSDLVVVPLSTNGQAFDRIRFLAAPYVAGAYAEGSYEFEIPVTGAILEIIRPDYRSAFVAAQSGAQ